MSIIKNTDSLASSPLRTDALAIAEAGLQAVQVHEAFARTMRLEGDTLFVQDKQWNIAGRRVFFVGIGKCALAGAEIVERMLGPRLTGGIALDVRGLEENHTLNTIEVFAGTHPRPSETNLAAAARIMELLNLCEESDLVLVLVSGGGSALLCLHDAPMTCVDEGVIFDALTQKGATIQEMNIVRKHTSYARGGNLAKAAYPAEVVALIVSDVPGNDIQYIASAPTVKDTSTVADAQAVLEKYGVALPPGGLMETPKEDKYFKKVSNTLFLSNKTALDAMKEEAQKRGYTAQIVTQEMHGEARDLARDIAEKLHAAPAKTAFLYGGESTVTLGPNPGPGGRNQELALAALQHVKEGELLLPFSSDGKDATKFAGAIADAQTLAHAGERGASAEESLASHASYTFFKTAGDALETGLLESNVSDLLLAIKN